MSKNKTKLAAVIDAPLQNGKPEFKIVPRDQVRPDPNQPRKDFNQEKLEDLAQPILVQLVKAEMTVREPDMINTEWHAVDRNGAVVFHGDERAVKAFANFRDEDYYQIVDGERRWRAAEIAGLTSVPVMTCDQLEEKKRLALQMVVNQQHQNLTELEEAASIDKMRKGGQFASDEEIWKSLGISRGTFFNRVALLRLHEPVKQALIAGKISTSVAGAIAMIPVPAQQEKLLAWLVEEVEEYGTTYSYREIVEKIEDEYMKQLKDAPFDQKDPELMHEMCDGPGNILYGGPCATCVARSGNLKTMFPDIKNANVCTRPDCFAKKCEAHFAAAAEEKRKKGLMVLTSVEFKKNKKDLVRIDERGWNGGEYQTWKEALGKNAPQSTIVVTADGLAEFCTKDELKEAAKKAGVGLPRENKPQSKEDREKEEAKRKQAEQVRETRKELAMALLPELAKGIAKLKDKDAWALLADHMEDRSYSEAATKLNKLCKDPRGRVFANGIGYVLMRVAAYDTGDWQKDTLELWNALGVDLKAEETKRTPKPELALSKPGPQQKELPGTAVKAVKKKGKRK